VILGVRGGSLVAVTLIGRFLSSPEAGAAPKVLVIVPAALQGGWKAEFDKWAGGRYHVTILGFSQKMRKAADLEEFCSDVHPRVVVCSFEMCRHWLTTLQQCGVGMLVVDEAHRVKNWKTGTYKDIQTLCKRRLLLTGTPLQNDIGQRFHAW